MKASIQERKIAQIIAPTVSDLGYDLIQVRVLGSAKLQTLQIIAENPDTGTLDLDGCTAVSRAISAVLDVEDPIAGAYQLEVSSPGIDRPLTRPQDFAKHVGYEMTLETEIPVAENGQKRFRGKLTGFANDEITILADDGQDIRVALEDVAKAKLVLTDELVKQSLAKAKQGAKQDESH
jgi:ribosome maturation factor RimP